MRNQTFVQEQHLLEAVHRKVINEQQMQDVLAIARAMGQQQSMPDMNWLTVVQCAVLIGMIGIPAIATTVQLGNGHPQDMLPFAVLGTAILLGITKAAQHYAVGRPVVGFAAMGAAFWAGGLGITLLGTFVFPMAFSRYFDYANVSYEVRNMQQSYCIIGGMLMMIAASAAIGRLFRVPTTAAVVGFATTVAAIGTAEQYYRGQHQSLGDMGAVGVMLFSSALLIGSAFLAEKLQKNTRYDVAFWLHTAGLFPLGLAGAINIGRHEGSTLLWAMAAAATIAIGTKIDRKSYIVAGCCALFGYIPFGASEAHMGDVAVGMSMAFSTLLVGIAVLIVRAVYMARAREGMQDSTQSVWG